MRLVPITLGEEMQGHKTARHDHLHTVKAPIELASALRPQLAQFVGSPRGTQG